MLKENTFGVQCMCDPILFLQNMAFECQRDLQGISQNPSLGMFQGRMWRTPGGITRDVCKTLTSHLPRSSPHLVHDETKNFGSIPSPHPAAHDETVLDQHLYLTH